MTAEAVPASPEATLAALEEIKISVLSTIVPLLETVVSDSSELDEVATEIDLFFDQFVALGDQWMDYSSMKIALEYPDA